MDQQQQNNNNGKNVAVGETQVPGSNPTRLQVYEFNDQDRDVAKSEKISDVGQAHRNVRYRECLKNHAASIGSHAVDGCGEFMAGEEALKCQACGCHRNFHRREVDGGWSYGGFVRGPYVGAAVEGHLSFVEEGHMTGEEEGHMRSSGGGLKKRFRTKFSGEQKEKMCAFSERLGWRIQKQDEGEVAKFCSEVGVRRNVLKVWMHNNKNTMGKNRSL